MKYAIVRLGGKQYKVSEGDTVLVDKLDNKKNSSFDFPEVLLIRTDESILIGSPFVTEGEVVGKVLEEVRGEKITVVKFKAKVRYRRKMGFRPVFSKVLIETITVGKKTTKKQRKPVD